MKNFILSFTALLLTIAGTSQEIDITGKNISIPSGSVTYTPKRNTFFGYQVSSQGSITKTFTIKNYGFANLTVGVVTATGDFTVSAQPVSPVAPNGFTTFTITYDPSTIATHTGTITIPNNDANEGTYTFGVQGVGLNVATQRRVRWVNNTGLPQPGTVVLQGVTYSVIGPVYTTVQTAINAATQYDIVYITDGRYFNPREAISTNCSFVGLGADPLLYDSIQNKQNIIITSQTGNHATSNARLVGWGFNLKGGNDITIQGLNIDSCRVNAFWNSNCCTYDPTLDVKILNNSINGTHGHGIKTDYWASGQGSVIDRGAWEINGNTFANIGYYNGYFNNCTPASVSAMWLGEAGGCFEIDGNTITNVRWAAVLCNGYGDRSIPANGAVTVSNNIINGTINAGVQLGWNYGGNGYIPANSYVTGNYIQNANTSNAAGIGAVVIHISYVGNTNILRNHITSSYNGVAINIAGWNNSMAADTSRIQYNNFCGLTAGSSAITHIGNQNGNGFFGTGDNLGKYKCDNNYYGSASGPTYYLNPGGIGWQLKEETTLIGAGPATYSIGDFAFLPFRTIPFPNPLVPACQCEPNSSNSIVTACGSYLWNSVNYTTSGTYSHSMPNAGVGGCDSVAFLVLTISNPALTALAQTNIACFGGNTGAASVNVATGGIAPYSYNWTPGNPTGDGTTSVTGLTAGTWTCTATDAAGCTATQTFNITQPAAPVSGTTVVTNVACFGGNTGAINLTPTGGTGPYTFNWLPSGPTTEDRTGLVAGTYSVQITDVNGCTGTVTATVTQPTSPVSGTTIVTNVSCFGGSNGAINLTPTGGTGPYTFNWLPSGPTTEDRTGLVAGTYSVQITDVNGCVGTVTATVTQPTSPVSGTTIVTNVACFGGNTGAINLTPTGGIGPYTFNWLPSGPTTEDRTGLTAGTYSVQITDVNGCVGTVTATVTQPTSPVSGTTIVTNVACFGGNTGAINLTPTGGTGPYTFNWLPSGPTTEDRTGLVAGTYSVQITDVNGCVGTVTATVTQPTSPVSGTTIVTNVSCFGGSNGAINLTPTGGTGPYTFNWLPSGPTTEDRTGLVAGTYSVQITDVNGCVGTVTATVTQPTSPVSGTTIVTNVSCFGGSNGAINLTPTGGTGPYTFNWLPSGPTTEDRTGLVAGTYSVQITDVNGCVGTVTATVTQPTSPVSGTTIVTNVACFGGSTGAINLTPTGGTGPYTFNWLPSGPTTEDRTGLIAGTYSVQITDVNGCVGTVTATVTQPTSPVSGTTIVTNVSCFGGSNGAINLTPTGGTGPYTFNWLPSGPTTEDRTGLIAGTYSVQITDVNGCVGTVTATVTQPTSPVSGTTIVTNVSCFGGSNGTINLTPTGGTGPYTFNWLPSGPTTEDRTGLIAGTYSVQITDVNGCIGTVTATVTQPPVLVVGSTATSILCNGGSSTVTVTGTGGTSPYTGTGTFVVTAGTHTYTVTDNNGCTGTTTVVVTEPTLLVAGSSATSILCNGGTSTVTVTGTGGTSPYTGTGTFTVTAGTHSYTVTDANGCTATTTVVITQPTALTAGSSATSILCNGGSSTVTVTGTGGTSPYTGTGTFTVTAGTHSYTVTDANGCTASTTVVITQPTALSAGSSATAILCNGGSSTVTVTGTGGTSPYTGTGTFTVTAGTHSYTVTDANGCTATTTVIVTEPTVLVAGSSATSVLCNGGTSTVTVTGTGGTSPYTGTGTFTVTAGTYTYTVTDANGCIATTTVVVTEPTALATGSSATSILCNGGNATVTVVATGGTAPYTGDGTFTVTAGTYSYVVTDANGCTSTSTITITEPAALSTSVTTVDVLCNGDTTGSIDVTVTGGTLPYTFDWNSGTYTTEDLVNIGAGSYIGVVTDANGCTDGGTIVISEPTLLVAVVTTLTDPSACGATDGAIDITVSGGVTAYGFLWTPSATTEDLSAIGAGAYSCVVTDANGCTTTVGANLSDPNAPTVTLTLVSDTVCIDDGAFTLSGESPVGGTFSGPGVTAGSFDPTTAGVGTHAISYTYTDGNGCTGSTVDSIYVDICLDAPQLIAGSTFTVYPNPNNGTFTLQLNNATIADVFVYDAQGKLVSTQKVQSSSQQIKLGESGMYMITVITTDGQRSTQRVIVTE